MSEEKRKRIIVVLGMHRSGTSAITRGLKALDVDLGEQVISSVAGNNEKGFWEDIDVNAFDNDLLHHLGHEWHTLVPIQRSELEQHSLESFKALAVNLLRRKLKDTTVFGLKDPRISRLLPFWKDVFKQLDVDVGYVIAVRHPLSVASSLKKRDGIELERSCYLWLGHVVPSMLESEGSPRVVVDYDLLMANPEKQLSRISEALGLPFNSSSPGVDKYKKEFLSDDLRHTQFRIDDFQFESGIPQDIVEAYFLLDKLARDQVAVSSEEVHDFFANLGQRLDEMPFAFVERQVASLSKQIADLKQTIIERDVEISRQSRLIEQTLGSRSWRITAPLRSATLIYQSVINSINSFLQKPGEK